MPDPTTDARRDGACLRRDDDTRGRQANVRLPLNHNVHKGDILVMIDLQDYELR